MSLNFTNIKATIGGKKLPWTISEITVPSAEKYGSK